MEMLFNKPFLRPMHLKLMTSVIRRGSVVSAPLMPHLQIHHQTYIKFLLNVDVVFALGFVSFRPSSLAEDEIKYRLHLPPGATTP